MFNKYIKVNPKIIDALENKKHIVALESTLISHGLPYPENIKVANESIKAVEESGSTAATIGIINGEIKTGVTTFFINERIDQGDILLQKEIIIENKDDFGSLYIKLSEVGADLVIKTVEGIFNNSLNPIKQNFIDDLKLAPKLNSENTRIDWNQSINYIIGQIKGLSPKPGAWTMIENGDNQFRMKILKAKNEKVSSLKNNLNGKIVIDNGELLIYNEHGAVNCSIIQLENKREMTAKELLNGLKFHENSRVY